ncbi:MAG: hypothetical protein ABI671_03790 [Burkholderiales bacterium]
MPTDIDDNMGRATLHGLAREAGASRAGGTGAGNRKRKGKLS